MDANQVVQRAVQNQVVVPSFNAAYLPMIQPILQAVVDENSVAMLQVAMIEWEQFGAISPKAVRDEYEKWKNPRHTLLHLDHIPAVGEDGRPIDYVAIIQEAIDLGYESVMIDASALDLEGNIEATWKVVQRTKKAGIPCEAELGAVLRHDITSPPYDEIFASKTGFTRLDEVIPFVKQSGCDWLSVAFGSFHGAVAEALKDQEKPKARLDIEHLKKIRQMVELPLVLHGGSGIEPHYIQQAIQNGVGKINVGTELRRAYQKEMEASGDIGKAQQATYETTRHVLRDFLCISNTADILVDQA